MVFSLTFIEIKGIIKNTFRCKCLTGLNTFHTIIVARFKDYHPHTVKQAVHGEVNKLMFL